MDMGCRPPAAGREVGGASYLLAHPYYSRDRLVDDGHGLQTTQARRAVGGASSPLVHPYYSRDSHTRQSTTTTTTPTHFEADASYPPMNRLIADSRPTHATRVHDHLQLLHPRQRQCQRIDYRYIGYRQDGKRDVTPQSTLTKTGEASTKIRGQRAGSHAKALRSRGVPRCGGTA
ncbi:hypothetical protein B0H34DRAFT_328294 [Crassisporium funariophilum]|nr:hypothetical protein B0H34DRAFT_328294 [Crassisporium funariophilum]